MTESSITNRVINIKSIEQFEEILDTNAEKLIIIDFFAEWCKPCKELYPRLKKMSIKYHPQVVFVKVNIDKFEDLSDQYEIEKIPTLKFVHDSQVVSTIIGTDSDMIEKEIGRRIYF